MTEIGGNSCRAFTGNPTSCSASAGSVLVLGANDGIVSTASLIVGVAAASATASEVVVAGIAGLVAGAMSMAAGEYVSVSSQSDTEPADLARERAEGGRRTFANTLKYISITTSANFGNMVSMALATPFLPFLPLAAKQILLNNFLSDLPSIAISSDNVDPERLAVPQRWNVKDIRRFMIVFGLVSSVFDLLTFGLLIWVLQAGEALFQTVWFMISLLTELAVVLVLRTRRPVLSSQLGAILLWSTAVVLTLTFAVPWLGPLSATFGFVPLSGGPLVAIVAILLAYIVATELVKDWFFRARVNQANRHARSTAN
jgi:Mg2+-importing ATPase